ncbi:hypothetical protein CMUS01_05776 [Colletotrichum musicola]|uniref:Uncharacterized protein n=1 Tax=Colletotrichum musicola TaxID=2175873 RepID=A0A8H6KPQ2_9PEZI|nr:hypothetical protein CMUS01_05776 [Colletotrichum musicola]
MEFLVLTEDPRPLAATSPTPSPAPFSAAPLPNTNTNTTSSSSNAPPPAPASDPLFSGPLSFAASPAPALPATVPGTSGSSGGDEPIDEAERTSLFGFWGVLCSVARAMVAIAATIKDSGTNQGSKAPGVLLLSTTVISFVFLAVIAAGRLAILQASTQRPAV